jgi:hypothetical protein
LLEKIVLKIAFRPHHFLCALCFQGKGYSPEFVANFSEIMAYLNSTHGDDAVINIVEHTDSICAPCPSKRDNLCVVQKKILKLDSAHADVLGIKPGETITWGQAKERIRNQMTLEKFHHACAPCAWKKLGMCENVLKHETQVKS